jgi:hypothetical protein
MTVYVHVNRNVIDANRKHGKTDPALIARVGKTGPGVYSNDIQVVKDGEVVARFRADFAKPILPCGARVVVETECEVWADGKRVT